MFVTQSIPPSTPPSFAQAEITQVYFPTAPTQLTNATGNQKAIGPYTFDGTVYCGHTVSTNGVQIGETGTYMFGWRAGITNNITQLMGTAFYLNNTATGPQIVDSTPSDMPSMPWHVAWRIAFTAGNEIAIGFAQQSNAVQDLLYGADGCRIWLCRVA